MRVQSESSKARAFTYHNFCISSVLSHTVSEPDTIVTDKMDPCDEGPSSALVPLAWATNLPSWFLPSTSPSFIASLQANGLTALLSAEFRTVQRFMHESVLQERAVRKLLTMYTVIQGIGLLRQFQQFTCQDPREHRKEALSFGQKTL